MITELQLEQLKKIWSSPYRCAVWPPIETFLKGNPNVEDFIKYNKDLLEDKNGQT